MVPASTQVTLRVLQQTTQRWRTRGRVFVTQTISTFRLYPTMLRKCLMFC